MIGAPPGRTALRLVEGKCIHAGNGKSHRGRKDIRKSGKEKIRLPELKLFMKAQMDFEGRNFGKPIEILSYRCSQVRDRFTDTRMV